MRAFAAALCSSTGPGLLALVLGACGLSIRGEAVTAEAVDGAIVEDVAVEAGTDAGVLPAPPVQLDLGPVLDVDIVLNRAAGAWDTTQDAIDATNHALLTAAAAEALAPGEKRTTLPDDGVIPATDEHPAVRLAARNDADGPNAKRLRPGESVTLTPPARSFSRLQIFGVATEGTSTLAVTLTHGDGTSTRTTLTFVDWFASAPGPGTFALASGLDRATIAPPMRPSLDRAAAASILGADVEVRSTAPITELRIDDTTATRAPRFHLLAIVGDSR